jgi:hypothetical protein
MEREKKFDAVFGFGPKPMVLCAASVDGCCSNCEKASAIMLKDLQCKKMWGNILQEIVPAHDVL